MPMRTGAIVAAMTCYAASVGWQPSHELSAPVALSALQMSIQPSVCCAAAMEGMISPNSTLMTSGDMFYG
jgi:hypothetical protein